MSNDEKTVQDRASQPAAEYVVGYLFSPGYLRVILIEKQKPAWQKGKLNGVGGKVEPGETLHAAMRREFREEAGVDIPEWLHFCTEEFSPDQGARRQQSRGARVHYFAAVATGEQWESARTMETEWVWRIDVDSLSLYRIIYNMDYLVPMARVLLQQPFENRPLP